MYEIQDRKYEPDPMTVHDIILDGKAIGWIVYSPNFAPKIHITIDSHKLDKKALSLAIRKEWPRTEGDYFIISELVTRSSLKTVVQKERSEENATGSS